MHNHLLQCRCGGQITNKNVATAHERLGVGASVTTNLRLAGQWEQQEGAPGSGQGEPPFLLTFLLSLFSSHNLLYRPSCLLLSHINLSSVFRICDSLVWIQILGSVHLIMEPGSSPESGSCSFRQCKTPTIFFNFLCSLLL